MSALRVSVATIDTSTGDEHPVGDLVFEPFDLEAVAKNPMLGMPQWKRLPLPSHEVLEMCAAFQADSTQVSIQVRAGSQNVAALMCSAPQVFKFLSPSGEAIVLAFRGGA